MGRVAWLAAITSIVLIGSAAAVASLASLFLDVGPSTMFLALAPGGLAEMSLIALALGVDTAFVTIMHILRVVLVVILAPYAFRILPGRAPRAPSPGD